MIRYFCLWPTTDMTRRDSALVVSAARLSALASTSPLNGVRLCADLDAPPLTTNRRPGDVGFALTTGMASSRVSILELGLLRFGGEVDFLSLNHTHVSLLPAGLSDS